MSNQAHNYIFYGMESNAKEVRQFTEHIIQSNIRAEEKGQQKSPVCIWGTHGIGKTALVEQIALENNYKFAYIAPAQFEEMGDLLGMPGIKNNQTVFNSPDWVPTENGPGILLIDDINRADDRILRGMMQLLQNYELVSWKLPAFWQIVLTANPDGGDYSVTPMDDAMLTRMMHVTMNFDAKVWAVWAEKEGIDARCINFVLTYPEIVVGKQSTPRSLVQFFQSIENIPDFSKDLALIQMLGSSCLDEETVAAFVAYVQQNLSELISPEDILNAERFEVEVAIPIRNMVQKEVLRVDILSTLCTRLVNFLTLRPEELSALEIKNIQSFIKMTILPNDLRLSLVQDLVNASNPSLKKVMEDPDLAILLLEGM